MKIRKRTLSYDQAIAQPRRVHQPPVKPMGIIQALLKLITLPDLLLTGFRYEQVGMERLPKDQPCLILMNHSSFIDLKIAFHVLGWRKFNIVCTSDGFVGKNWLMRLIGCIPTNKFVTDTTLIRDMKYALDTLGSSVLMYPEASYSFDGTATPLPDTTGRLLKLLKVPVVMITTHGAFARDPLYNGLQRRKVKVSAEVKYLLTPEEIAAKSADELNDVVNAAFGFDNFRWQQENRVAIKEKFRADGLHRVLYKCPHCGNEHAMLGRGVTLRCGACGKDYILTEFGHLEAADGHGKFDHVPDWYAWEREEVRKEILEGTYRLDTDVDIAMLVNTKWIYQVGEGHLTHTEEGFHLTGCGGKIDYRQLPQSSYSLYADYFWYEIGDVICIGDREVLYYCFPKDKHVPVAKARLATEELFKLKKRQRKRD